MWRQSPTRERASGNCRQPQRLNCLCGRFSMEQIPVGEQLIRRHIGVDGKCKLCGRSESINHLFFECNFAQKVWAATPLMPSFKPRGTIALEHVWNNLCERVCLPPICLIKSSLAPWVIWQIWITRNAAIFNDRWTTPEDIVSKAIYLAKEWETNQVKRTTERKSVAGQRLAPENCAMVRSDAAWREDLLMAGCGWTISDQTRTRSF